MTRKYLNQIVTVKMDRPLGTKHPKHGFIYPVNYGYIPNTISGDGEELDVYIRTGEIDDKAKKELIDKKHKNNLFKLKLMPVFDAGIETKA